MKKIFKKVAFFALLFMLMISVSVNNKDVKANISISKDNTSTLKFNASGGEGDMPDQDANINESIQLNKNEFTKAGYKFIGWSICPQEKIVPVGETGGEANCDDIYEDEASFEPTEPYHYFYAVFKNASQVHFNANGGTGTMASIDVYETQWVALPPNEFTKDGYDFSGWAVAKTADKVGVKTSSKITCPTDLAYEDEQGFKYNFTEDMTLCAIWEKSDSNGIDNGGTDEKPDSNGIDNGGTDAVDTISNGAEISTEADLPNTGSSMDAIISSLLLLIISSGIFGFRLLKNRK